MIGVFNYLVACFKKKLLDLLFLFLLYFVALEKTKIYTWKLIGARFWFNGSKDFQIIKVVLKWNKLLGEVVDFPSLKVCSKRLHGHWFGVYDSSWRVNIDDLISIPILRVYDSILGCVFQECFNVITIARANLVDLWPTWQSLDTFWCFVICCISFWSLLQLESISWPSCVD